MPDPLFLLAKTNIWSHVANASLLVKAVMLLLAMMSVFGWYIIGYKYFYLKKATKETQQFLESFWRSRDIEQIYKQAQSLRTSPVSAMFLAGYTELAKLSTDEHKREEASDLENVQRALRRTETVEVMKLESWTPFLATTGSAAPFNGLFGTVVGIMNSFTNIADQGSASLQTVAPGIAEALFATAIGLVAAIPAVMAFNYFQRGIRVQRSAMQTFEQDYLNIVRRHFL